MNLPETHKAIVSRYVEASNRGDSEELRLFTPDAVQGVLGSADRDKVLGIWRELHDAFAMELDVQEIIAETDRVAAHYIERGKFRGEFGGHTPRGQDL